MKNISKNIVFYFVIMEEDRADHKNLRTFIRRLVPQAIIESIYNFEEALNFFKANTLKPHILFLSDELSKAGLSISSDGYVNSLLLDMMPVVFLNKNGKSKHEIQPSFSKPFDHSNFFNLVGSFNRKWLKA